MAIDQDGYDNIMDPNTMESLPKLSGFGSGNLSGSNLYIPVYNSITGEYQKVTVADVQPDYSGVKNSLLADAITTNAAPANLPNMLHSPCLGIGSNVLNTSTSRAGIATRVPVVTTLGLYGCGWGWTTLCSTGTVTIASGTNGTFKQNDGVPAGRYGIPQGTRTNGVGEMSFRVPTTSTTAQSGYFQPIPIRTGSNACGMPVSFSLCYKNNTSTTAKLWVGILSVDSSAVLATPTAGPIAFGASDVAPTAAGGTGTTLLASTQVSAAALDTWYRVALENVSVPTDSSSLYVVIIENTARSGAGTFWMSGAYLHKGTKAAIYASDPDADSAKVGAICNIVASNQGVENNVTSTTTGRYAAQMGVWTTTTNFRIMIPWRTAVAQTSNASSSRVTVGFTGTISNISVEEYTGVARAASAWTSTARAEGIELNITTAASTAGFVGFLSAPTQPWESNFWSMYTA